MYGLWDIQKGCFINDMYMFRFSFYLTKFILLTCNKNPNNNDL
jgi:hypothetical protein